MYFAKINCIMRNGHITIELYKTINHLIDNFVRNMSDILSI